MNGIFIPLFFISMFNFTLRCSFKFDPDNFPDPKAYLAEIKSKFNAKVCVWSTSSINASMSLILIEWFYIVNPYISQLSPIFKEAVENGYLINRKDGTPWQWDLWQPGMGIIDITNPDTQKWYSKKLEDLLDMGVDCFKVRYFVICR